MLQSSFKLCTAALQTSFAPRSLFSPPALTLLVSRFKSKKSSKGTESSEASSEDSEETVRDKNTKILKINVTSLRVDAILKSGLGMARNKIETQFYENKIRLNGQKVSKKSVSVQEGDEIDLIKGPDVKNPSFINVARIEILSIKPHDEESIVVKLKRCKSLSVEES